MQNKYQISKAIGGGQTVRSQNFKTMSKKVYLGYQPTQIINEPKDSGQSIEEMVRKAVATNDPIEATAPMVYTEKAKGVLPETDMRTDRFDLAIDAIDKFTASERAKEKTPQPETQNETEQPTYVTE